MSMKFRCQIQPSLSHPYFYNQEDDGRNANLSVTLVTSWYRHTNYVHLYHLCLCLSTSMHTYRGDGSSFMSGCVISLFLYFLSNLSVLLNF